MPATRETGSRAGRTCRQTRLRALVSRALRRGRPTGRSRTAARIRSRQATSGQRRAIGRERQRNGETSEASSNANPIPAATFPLPEAKGADGDNGDESNTETRSHGGRTEDLW